MRLDLTAPIPPSVNKLYATVNGRRVLSKAGREYKHEVGWLARAAVQVQRFDFAPDDRLALHITIHFPDRRRCDLSNRIKVLEDGLAEAVGFDDQRIDDLHIVRGAVDRDRPRVEITLLRLDHGVPSVASQEAL